MKKMINKFVVAAISLATLLITGSAWAAVGDQITFSNAGKGGGAGAASFNAGTLSITIPASDALPAGTVVRLNSITLGLNSSGDTVYPYMKVGDGYSNQTSKQTSGKFPSNAWKELYSFTDEEIDLVVGTSYPINFYSEKGGTAQQSRFYNRNGAEGISPLNAVVINSNASNYRPEQEVVVTVLPPPSDMATATISASDNWSAIVWDDVAPEAGSPVELTFSGSNTLTLDTAAVGKSFLIKGNSSADQTIKIAGSAANVAAFATKVTLDSSFTGNIEYEFDATASSFTADDALKTFIKDATTNARFIFMGANGNGATLNFGTGVNKPLKSHLVFVGGTHAMTYGYGGSGSDGNLFGMNGSGENPTVLVRTATTLNFTAKDLSYWGGAANVDGVIRVNDGAILNFLEDGNNTFFYRQRLWLDPGSLMTFNFISKNQGGGMESCFRWHGGSGEATAQIYVPDQPSDQTANPATIRQVTGDGAKGGALHLASDATQGLAFYIGANAKLVMDTPFTGGGRSAVKYGSGTIEFTKEITNVNLTISAGAIQLDENAAQSQGSFTLNGKLVWNGGSIGTTIGGTPTGLTIMEDVTLDDKLVGIGGDWAITGGAVVDCANVTLPLNNGALVGSGNSGVIKLPAGFTTGNIIKLAGDAMPSGIAFQDSAGTPLDTVQVVTVGGSNYAAIKATAVTKTVDAATHELSWSQITWDDDGAWEDGLEGVFNLSGDLTLTIDQAVTGSLTFDGTGNVKIVDQNGNLTATLVNMKAAGTITIESAKSIPVASSGAVIYDFIGEAGVSLANIIGSSITINTAVSVNIDAGSAALIYHYTGTGSIAPSITNVGDFTWDSAGTITGLNFGTSYTGTVTINNGTISVDTVTKFGSAPKMVINYPAVLELTNTANSTAELTVNCSGITGTGTIRYKSSNNWRALPNSVANFWSNTLGFETEEGDSSIVTIAGGGTTDLGSLSGAKGFRSDYTDSNPRNLRITQSRNTTWSGKFNNSDRIGTVYVAGTQVATEKTLTIAGTHDADNILNVESTGSVNLTGTWKGNVTVAGEFGGSGSVIDASAITINAGAKIRADFGVATLNVAPTFGSTLNVTLPQGATANGYKILTLSGATPTYVNCTATVGGVNTYILEQKTDGVYLVEVGADGITIDVAADTIVEKSLIDGFNYKKTGNGTLVVNGLTTGKMTVDAGSVRLPSAFAGTVLISSGKTLVGEAGYMPINGTLDAASQGTIKLPANYEIGGIIKVYNDFTVATMPITITDSNGVEIATERLEVVSGMLMIKASEISTEFTVTEALNSTDNYTFIAGGSIKFANPESSLTTTGNIVIKEDTLPVSFVCKTEAVSTTYTLITAAKFVDGEDEDITSLDKIAFTGDFYKCFTGTPVLVNNGNGTWSLKVTVAAATYTQAVDDLIKSAIHRFDASRGVETDANGVVTAWNNPDKADDKALPYTNGQVNGAPTLANNKFREYLDFGAVSSQKDMTFTRLTDVRTVIEVIDIAQDAKAFLMGDHANGGSSAYNFHRGTSGQYGANNNAKFSTVRDNGTQVNWSSDLIPTGARVISMTMSIDAATDCFSQDRNQSGRNGGRKLSEVLIFNTTLTADQQKAIEDYLMAKWDLTGHTHGLWDGEGDGTSWADGDNWDDGSAPGNGDTVTIAGTTAPVIDIDGTVQVAVVQNSTFTINSGTLKLAGTNKIINSTITLGENGGLDNNGWPTFEGTVTINTDYTKSILNNSGGNTSRISGGAAFVKGGTGALTLKSAANEDFDSITVKGGKLILSCGHRTYIYPTGVANLNLCAAGAVEVTAGDTLVVKGTIDLATNSIDADDGLVGGEGTLQVTETTTYAFPADFDAGDEFVLTTGTLSAPTTSIEATITVGGVEKSGVFLTYDAVNKSVSYAEARNLAYEGTVAISKINTDAASLPAIVTLTGDASVKFDVAPTKAIEIVAGTGVTTLKLVPADGAKFVSLADIKKLTYVGFTSFKYDWAAGEVISLNFGSNETNASMSGEGKTDTFAGTQIPDASWINLSGGSGTDVAVNKFYDSDADATFDISDMTVSFGSRGGSYHPSGSNYPFMRGYLDDNTSSRTSVTLKNVPFATYDVIVYMQGDGARPFTPIEVTQNETSTKYTYKDNAIVSGDWAVTDTWGLGNQTDISYEHNVIRITNLSGDATISPVKTDNANNRRGTLAAIQIVNTGTPLVTKWIGQIGVASAWDDDSNWNNGVPTANTIALFPLEASYSIVEVTDNSIAKQLNIKAMEVTINGSGAQFGGLLCDYGPTINGDVDPIVISGTIAGESQYGQVVSISTVNIDSGAVEFNDVSCSANVHIKGGAILSGFGSINGLSVEKNAILKPTADGFVITGTWAQNSGAEIKPIKIDCSLITASDVESAITLISLGSDCTGVINDVTFLDGAAGLVFTKSADNKSIIASKTCIWTGESGDDWNDPDNWQGGVVPMAGIPVIINLGTDAGAYTINLPDSAVEVGSLTLSGSATSFAFAGTGSLSATSYNISGLTAATIDLSKTDFNADYTIPADSTLVVNGVAWTSAATFAATTSKFRYDGAYTAINGTFAGEKGTVEIGGTFTAAGDITLGSTTVQYAFDGNITVNGVLTVGSSSGSVAYFNRGTINATTFRFGGAGSGTGAQEQYFLGDGVSANGTMVITANTVDFTIGGNSTGLRVYFRRGSTVRIGAGGMSKDGNNPFYRNWFFQGGKIVITDTCSMLLRELKEVINETELEVMDEKTLTLTIYPWENGMTRTGSIRKTGAGSVVFASDPAASFTIAGGDATIAAGLESRITVVEGGTLKLKVTDAQWITGYTSTATIPENTNIVFIAPDGNEITGTSGKVLPPKPANKTWVGGTGNWDVADNWNPSGVPSATDTIRIESTTGDIAITLPTEGVTVAGATFVGDNAITLVDGAFNPGALAKIGAGTLSMTLGADIAQPMNIEGTVAFAIPEEETTRTLSGIISGSGKIVKNGAGELVLSGANTFTGGTEITAGTLKSSNAAALGAGNGTAQDPDIVIGNGAKLDFAQGNCTAAYWIVSNGGEITNTGSDIGNANNGIKGLTLGGDTTISGNKMSFYTGNQAATAIELGSNKLTVNMNSNKELTLVHTTVTGEGTIDIASGIVAVRSPRNASSDKLIVSDALVVVRAGAKMLFGYDADLADVEFENGAEVTWNNSNRSLTANGTVKFDGSATWNEHITLVISETGTLESSVSIPKITFADGATVKKVGDTVASINGTAELTLSGTIKLDVTGKTAAKLPAGTEIDVFTTTTEITEDEIGDIIAASEQNFQPYVTVSEDDTPVYTVGVVATYDAEVTWDGTSGDWTATSFNGIPDNYGDDQQTAIFTDAASGTDAITVTVVDGPRTVKGISFDAERNITINGSVVVNGAITKAGAGRAEITGTTTVSGAISVTAGTLAINFAADYAQAIPVNGVLEVNVPQGVTRTLSGVISGSGKVVKTGAGTLVLSAANTFTGGLEINEGIVRAGNVNGLGSDSNGNAGKGEVRVSNGATLEANGQRLENTIYLSGNGVDGNGALVNNGSDMGGSIRTTIHLTGDASWGGSGYFHFGANSSVNLHNFTFTKKGSNAFPVNNTTIHGPGKIVVAEGIFDNNNNNNTLDQIDLEVLSGATLRMKGSSLTVRDFTCNGTIDNNTAVLKVNGTIHGGATIPKLQLFNESTVELAQGQSITVGNTLTLPTEGTITLDVTGYNTVGDYTVITAPNNYTWDTTKVTLVGNEGWEMYVDGNELKVKLLTLDANISTSEGYNYTGVSIDVDVTRIAEGEKAFINLVVKNTNGQTIGEIAQVEITGKGLYQVPVEKLTTGADYTYEVTIVDEDGEIIEGSKSDDGTVTLGDVQTSDLFSASAETTESVVVNGAWDVTPEIPTIESESEEEEVEATKATYYQIADDVTSVFTVNNTVEFGDLVTIDFEIAFDEGFTTEIDQTEGTAPQAGVTISAEAESATKYWYVCDNGAWKATTTEAIPGAYTVTMEFNYNTNKVRYFINGTPLTDGSKFWFDNGVEDATEIATVAFTGDSRLTKFGASAVTIDTNLVAVGNDEYATLAEAITAKGADANFKLLTNVAIDTLDIGEYTIDVNDKNFKWAPDTTKFITFKEGKFVVANLEPGTKPANGLDSYISYELQLNPEDATDKPFIKQFSDGKTDKLTFKCYHGTAGAAIVPRNGAKATYQIEVATDPAFGTGTLLETSPKAKVDQPIDVELPSDTSKGRVRYYRAKLNAE